MYSRKVGDDFYSEGPASLSEAVLERHDIEHAPIALVDVDGDNEAVSLDPAVQWLNDPDYHQESPVTQRTPASNLSSVAQAPNADSDYDFDDAAFEQFVPDQDTHYEWTPSALADDAKHDDRVLDASLQPDQSPPSNRHAAVSAKPLLHTLFGILLALVLIGATAWGALLVRDPTTLPIKSVRVEGTFTHITSEALQQAIAHAATGGFLYVDVGDIRRAAQRLPWVKDISVRRVWPDTLRVTVTEQTAVARWGDQGLLNAEGTVFAPHQSSYPAGLPELQGPPGTQTAMLGQYHAMSQTLAPHRLRITHLELDARRAWRVKLSNGIELMLGRTDSYARLQRFARVYNNLLSAPAGTQSGVIDRIDLRYSNGLAVHWNTTPQTPATQAPAAATPASANSTAGGKPAVKHKVKKTPASRKSGESSPRKTSSSSSRNTVRTPPSGKGNVKKD